MLKHVNNLPTLEIDHDGAVAGSLSPRPVINPDSLKVRCTISGFGRAFQLTQNGVIVYRLTAGGSHVLAVFWHGKYFPLFALAEGLEATVFAGRSFRGEVVSDLSRRFGYNAQFIVANHNGQSADRIRAVYKSAKLGAIAVDGPLGPYHMINAGAVMLASELGLLVVSVSVASSPIMVLPRCWDRREPPVPFARVALAVGEPIAVPGGLGRTETAEWAIKIRAALEEADSRAACLRC